MKKIKSVSDLPKWFSYEKYNQLYDLTKEQLLKQIYFRINSIYEFHEDIERDISMEDLFVNSVIVDDSMLMINNFKFFHAMEDYNEINKGFVECGGIEPISVGLTAGLVDSEWRNAHQAKLDLLEEFSITGILNSEDNKLMDDDFDVPLTLYLKETSDESGVYAHIDLAYSDEFLLEDLKRVLPMWRKAMGQVNKKCLAKNTTDVILNKSLEYRVVPILDLKLWSLENNVSIPNSVLVAAVYPLGEKGEYQLTQTVMGFIKKISSREYVEKMERYISLDFLPDSF
ncbi:MAG: hypothetical protein EKE20_15505 [Candidatus Symbiopectobacterium sp. Dall1.0]|nr:hypothetical protein [Candidatus Symbiopectobacterium sp. Dall1.0]